MDQFTLFSNLLKQLLQLVQVKKDAERNWVADVVDPLAIRFESVAREYIEFFHIARKETLSADFNDDTKLREIMNKLTSKRQSTLETRKFIQAFIKSASLDAPDDVLKYLRSIQRFFKSAGFNSQNGSAPKTLIDIYSFISGESAAAPLVLNRNGNLISVEQINAHELDILLEESVEHLEKAWENYSRLYGNLKFNIPK